MGIDDVAPQRRTGGRSALVLTAVRNAVEELIAERGSERVTIPLVAERAGVNPTSIYRRWGDMPTMINDLATYRLDPARPIPQTGDLRSDLTAWARGIVDHYRNPVNAALLRGGAASAGETESDCFRNRRAEATALVGQAGTDSPFGADDVIDHLVAPIVYRVIFLPRTVDAEMATALVDRLFETAPAVTAGAERENI
jgi:AcrR family transcriptional regulator